MTSPFILGSRRKPSHCALVTVAANSHIEISESFGAEADVSDCVVKAFFVRKENVKPFEADVLPLIELDYIN